MVSPRCALQPVRHLIETVIGLVCASPAGVTAAELGEMLGVNAHSFISRFRWHSALHREKIDGRFVFRIHCGEGAERSH